MLASLRGQSSAVHIPREGTDESLRARTARNGSVHPCRADAGRRGIHAGGDATVRDDQLGPSIRELDGADVCGLRGCRSGRVSGGRGHTQPDLRPLQPHGQRGRRSPDHDQLGQLRQRLRPLRLRLVGESGRKLSVGRHDLGVGVHPQRLGSVRGPSRPVPGDGLGLHGPGALDLHTGADAESHSHHRRAHLRPGDGGRRPADRGRADQPHRQVQQLLGVRPVGLQHRQLLRPQVGRQRRSVQHRQPVWDPSRSGPWRRRLGHHDRRPGLRLFHRPRGASDRARNRRLE